MRDLPGGAAAAGGARRLHPPLLHGADLGLGRVATLFMFNHHTINRSGSKDQNFKLERLTSTLSALHRRR